MCGRGSALDGTPSDSKVGTLGASVGKTIIGSFKEAREKSFVETTNNSCLTRSTNFRDIAALTARLLGRPVIEAGGRTRQD